MSTAPNYYAVCQFHKDGTVFPVRMSITTEREAQQGRAWMMIGAGQFDDWRVIPMSELPALLTAERIDLSCFTKEAQEAKRAEILKHLRHAPTVK